MRKTRQGVWAGMGEPHGYTALGRAGAMSARPLHDISAKRLETTFPKVFWSIEMWPFA